MLTGEQLQRINARLRPQLDAERARLAHAQPDANLAAYAGPGVADVWAAADEKRRKAILRLVGMRIAIRRVGPGRGRSYDPDAVSISWSTDGLRAIDAA